MHGGRCRPCERSLARLALADGRLATPRSPQTAQPAAAWRTRRPAPHPTEQPPRMWPTGDYTQRRRRLQRAQQTRGLARHARCKHSTTGMSTRRIRPTASWASGDAGADTGSGAGGSASDGRRGGGASGTGCDSSTGTSCKCRVQGLGTRLDLAVWRPSRQETSSWVQRSRSSTFQLT